MKTRGKVQINFEVTPAEREQIRQNAAWMELPVATYIRRAALGQAADVVSARRRVRRAKAA